jgi:hypothetical protein
VVVIRTLLCEVADFLIGGGRRDSLDMGSSIVSYWNSRARPLLRVSFWLRKYVEGEAGHDLCYRNRRSFRFRVFSRRNGSTRMVLTTRPT